MKTQKRRGLLAKAGALLAVAALAFSASPSYAQSVVTPTESDVIITKLEQGADANAEATGKPLGTAPNPINGVTYEAYKVPLNETPGSNEWQVEIAGIKLGDAVTAVEGEAAVYSGTTDTIEGNVGQVRWTMDRGLYLVRETKTPAGVVASPDFLVAVPMTDPGDSSKWLDKIYIYPKSDKVSAAMTVDNAADYSVGNTLTWTINADIPQIRDTVNNDFLPTDKFEIVANFDSAGLLITEDDITIPGLTLETPYEVDVDTTTTPGTTIVRVTLTETGRTQLASILTGGTPTIDVKVDAEVQTVGEFTPTATVFAASTDANGEAVDTSLAAVKYGKVTLTKKDQNGQLAKDAVFRVYTSETDAVAKNSNFLKTALNTEGEWTTGEDGKVTLEGFRFSDFANGTSHSADTEGSLYQTYWLVEMTAPKGQQLLAEPIPFAVTAVDNNLAVTNTANTNAFVLPLTGGTGTAMLTILGLGILAIVLFVARSRRNAEA